MTEPIVIRFTTPKNRPLFPPSGRAGLYLTIGTPSPPGPVGVGANFTTQGYLAPGDTIQSASIQPDGGGATTNGTPIGATPPYAWAFQFSGIPKGTYVLTVVATNGGQAVVKTCIVTVP